ncbi:MAG: N-acetyltransferase family protein [Gammaproteobacteria bacterium]
MRTRLAIPEDARAIAEVHVRSWQAAYATILDPAFLAGLSAQRRALGWQAALGAGESTTVVGEKNGQVVAFVSYGACRDEGAPAHRGEIWAIYAIPQAWGTGVGRQLLHDALAALRTAGKSDCTLWVLADNARGLDFYRRAGFQQVPDSGKVFDLGGRQVQEVQLRLDLRASARPPAGQARPDK